MDGKANKKMSEKTSGGMRPRIWRRIVVKGAIFAVWAAGMLALALQGGHELPQHTYLYMLFAMLVVGTVSTVRDVRRLRRAGNGRNGR